ncbi:MAG: hypothetical protein KC910_33755, partial [Candidatus Eremiobacteraeota bacterium]|nr:hypothetical protein [Candidatus Eremiobacteraeota bacterium]
MADEHQTVVFCTDVASGRPQAGVEVSLRPAGDKAVTDEHGLARLPARSGQIVAASRGGDRCFLYDLGSVTPAKPNLLWYVFDDRGLYRPGETVHLKGWVRQESSLKAWSGKLDYVAYDNDDHKLAEGKTTVRASGGFEVSFALPDTPALGSARVELHCPDDFAEATYEHRFRVEEFRRPEFEVEASSGDGPFFVGERGTAQVSARYYTGSPLTNAHVKWQVVAEPEAFEPPGHPEFHFGYVPEYQGYFEPRINGLAFGFKWFEGRTDAQGNHILTIDFKSVWPPRPTRLDASATVQDVNRQKWSVGTSLLVHPSELYVGLRQIGATPRFEVLVTDLEGKPVSDAAVEVWLGNEHQQVVSALGPITVEFASSRASRVGARVYDSKGRVNITELPVWMAGLSNSDEHRISMRPDKPEYAPGETAEILVRTPFEAASGIFWCGLDRVEPVAFEGNLATLRVPVPDGVPNLRVEVLAVGADGQALRESLSLAVSLEPHRLGVEVAPASSQLEPGASTSVEVAVTGAEAAGCEVALWVVD